MSDTDEDLQSKEREEICLPDKIEDICYKQVSGRSSGSNKKKSKGGFKTNAKGTRAEKRAGQNVLISSRGSDKHRKSSDKFKIYRNAQRVAKELETVLQVFDFGEAEKIDDTESERVGKCDEEDTVSESIFTTRESLETLSDTTDQCEIDVNAILDEVSAAAFADLSLERSSANTEELLEKEKSELQKSCYYPASSGAFRAMGASASPKLKSARRGRRRETRLTRSTTPKIPKQGSCRASSTEPRRTSDESSTWEESPENVIRTVLQNFPSRNRQDPFEYPPHVIELQKRGNEMIENLSNIRNDAKPMAWSERHIEGIREAIVLMNEIVSEMKEHNQDLRSLSTPSSGNSMSSLHAQNEQTLLLLLSVLQNLYEEVSECCLLALFLVEEWFCPECELDTVAKTSFSHAVSMIRVLSQVQSFELIMCYEGIGPAKITRSRNSVEVLEKRIHILSKNMNDVIFRIQTSILNQTDSDVKHNHDCCSKLHHCWEGLWETTHRLAHYLPCVKEKTFTMFFQTLKAAAEALKTINDSEEVQKVIIRETAEMPSFVEEEPAMGQENLTFEEGSMSCLGKLLSVANCLVRDVRKGRSSKHRTLGLHWENRLEELKNVFVDLVFISVARIIKVTRASETHQIPEIQKRRDLGLKMLHLARKCDRSKLLTNFEESNRYSVFSDLTTTLLNNVLNFQTKLQMNDIAGNSVAEHPVSGDISGELIGEPSKDCGPYPFAPLTDTQVLRGNILNYILNNDASNESNTDTNTCNNATMDPKASENAKTIQETSVSDISVSPSCGNSICMPNPFANGPSDKISLPEHMFSRGSSENRNSELISPSQKRSIETHPLFHITDSESEAIPSTQIPLPEAENFRTIKKNELIYGPRLGKGSTGQVFRMSYYGSPVAVKIVNHPKLLDSKEKLIHESDIHTRIANHPNIVQYYGKCVGMENDDDAVGLVMELCELGNLYKAIGEARWIRNLLKDGRDITEFEKTIGYMFYSNWPLRLKMACDIAAGMAYLHSREIIHRDLTSYNVVLSQGSRNGNVWNAKVCDFERSRRIPHGTTIPRSDNLPNSPAWAAPEVLRNEDYSLQADVFSMGVILWEIVTLEIPWDIQHDGVVRDIFHVIYLVSNRERLELPTESDVPLPELSRITHLIRSTWEERPDDRPTMQQFREQLCRIKDDVSERIRSQMKANNH